MKRLIIAAFAIGVAVPQARAHAVFAEGEATAGESFLARLGVTHGCDGLATQGVTIVLPDGFVGAKPMPKPGWTLDIVEGDYARAYELHGRRVTSGPIEIRWTGGSLDDAWYDEFVVRGSFDASVAGTDVPFVATQHCGQGASIAWKEIAAEGADPHALDYPAPTVRVSAATGVASHAHGASAASAAIAVTGGFARAMLPNAPTGGGYLTLTNRSDEADRLVSIASPAARTVEIHTMAMEGDIMRMRPLPEGVAIAPGETVALAPGGMHLMFDDVLTPFVEGNSVPVTLTFEKAGPVETTLVVGPPNASAADGGHAHH